MRLFLQQKLIDVPSLQEKKNWTIPVVINFILYTVCEKPELNFDQNCLFETPRSFMQTYFFLLIDIIAFISKNINSGLSFLIQNSNN